jgi:DNA mismatch repair ATPase MutS/predicted GIY-YIG superfamily endonuclease
MSREEAVPNDFVTDGMALLTAANMSGKSTLLRTVTAACLLANCGLCVPADSAVVPVFDVIFLRNTAYDAPKEGKSSFGVEMSDIRDLLDVVTPRSLVMVDELGKGTSSSEGAALSGAILEHFGSIGCYGVFASHLFELFELPIEVGNLELLTMEVIVHSSACVNEGQSKHIDPTGGSSARSTTGATVGYRRSVEWTYRVKAGQADSSLALDAARHFDVPASIIDRAHALLATSETMRQRSEGIPTAYAAQPSLYADAATSMDRSITCADENSDAVNREQHSDLDYSDLVVTELSRLRGSDGHRVKSVLPQWLPPPRDRMLSVVYALRLPAPDGRWYVGESDDVSERIQEHRRSLAKRNAIFHYVVMPNKSEATRAEAELITTLLNCGVPLLSSRDAGRKRTSASRE